MHHLVLRSHMGLQCPTFGANSDGMIPQVNRMMVYEDIGFQENLLHSAIKSGRTDAFDNVLATLTERLTEREVRWKGRYDGLL